MVLYVSLTSDLSLTSGLSSRHESFKKSFNEPFSRGGTRGGERARRPVPAAHSKTRSPPHSASPRRDLDRTARAAVRCDELWDVAEFRRRRGGRVPLPIPLVPCWPGVPALTPQHNSHKSQDTRTGAAPSGPNARRPRSDLQPRPRATRALILMISYCIIWIFLLISNAEGSTRIKNASYVWRVYRRDSNLCACVLTALSCIDCNALCS